MLHYKNHCGLLVREQGFLQWFCPKCSKYGQSKRVLKHCPACTMKGKNEKKNSQAGKAS